MATKAKDSNNFEIAYAQYEKISRTGSRAEKYAALRLCFSTAATVQNVLKAWRAGGKDVFTWDEVRAKMLKLSATPEDAWVVFRRSKWNTKDSNKDLVAFEKVLTLCKSKEQVQNVYDPMREFSYNHIVRHREGCKALSIFFEMMALREAQLPSCPEDRRPMGVVYERGHNRTYQRWGFWPDV